MLEEITALSQAPLGMWETLVRVGLSLAASAIAYLLYQLFYGSRHIGAGVHRVFLLGGPAITMIFLVIQTSIPLGIGLLGALSFVRFRTPIKDPAEIGFLLLLIASSIGIATGNLLPTAILFCIATIALAVERLVNDRASLSGRGHLMVSLDREAFEALDKAIGPFLAERLRGLRMETMSTVDGRVGLNYNFRRRSNFDWGTFNNELNTLAGPDATVDIFVS